jgi:hypothetical protein
VEFEAVLDLALLEVPEEDLCDLSGEGVLCAGDVLAVLGDLDGCVGRGVQETLWLWPRRKVCVRERMCLTTTVEPSG